MDYPANATLYVRLSLMLPRDGELERVVELHRRLVEWLPSLPGFVRGYLIVSGDPQGRVGHLNVWRSEDDADHAAQTDHVLATRAELKLLVDEDSHAEHSYVAYDPQLA
ncbi:MAG: antibiotic biosynthesis monooxygenase [Chloroflexi bacterium]|nr:antibiotic biosynthesis monooxygenase [Chloroflexota bacterium]